MGKRLEQTYHQSVCMYIHIQTAHKHMKRCSSSYVICKGQFRTRYHRIFSGMSNTQNTDHTRYFNLEVEDAWDSFPCKGIHAYKQSQGANSRLEKRSATQQTEGSSTPDMQRTYTNWYLRKTEMLVQLPIQTGNLPTWECLCISAGNPIDTKIHWALLIGKLKSQKHRDKTAHNREPLFPTILNKYWWKGGTGHPLETDGLLGRNGVGDNYWCFFLIYFHAFSQVMAKCMTFLISEREPNMFFGKKSTWKELQDNEGIELGDSCPASPRCHCLLSVSQHHCVRNGTLHSRMRVRGMMRRHSTESKWEQHES